MEAEGTPPGTPTGKEEAKGGPHPAHGAGTPGRVTAATRPPANETGPPAPASHHQAGTPRFLPTTIGQDHGPPGQ